MDTFCVLPWYSSELPDNRPCCWMAKDANIDQVKKDLLAGVKSPACAKCWQLEQLDKSSRRQLENQSLNHKLNQGLEQLKESCEQGLNQTVLYQITTSNLCNQACVSCNSKASTKWAEIETRMTMSPWVDIGVKVDSWIPYPYTYVDPNDLDINYQTARRISFLGGEPFYDSATFRILEKLIAAKNHDCFISIVTNGSVTLNTAQIQLLQQFTDLNICISIDGTGPVFEYMRWPGNWNQLVINLKQYKTITENISVSYTISALNVFYHEQTVEWFERNNLKFNYNTVSWPSWLALSNTPTVLRNNQFVQDFCKDDVGIDHFVKYIENQDRAKRIHIKDYMPEVAALIGLA